MLNKIVIGLIIFFTVLSIKNNHLQYKKAYIDEYKYNYKNQINRFYMNSWYSNTNNFNGIITSIKTTVFDTLKSYFYVCDSIIRIDNFDKNFNPVNTYIYYLNKNECYVINDKLKAYKYKKIPVTNYNNDNIIKTKIFKYINGKKCFLWKIKHENKIYSYWVTGKNYNFYYKICGLFYNKNKATSIFASSKFKGIMPMLVEERTKLRQIISQYKITQIEPAVIDYSVFKIPKNYKLIN